MSTIETLRNNNISSLWHFTDRSNVASIMENGILSLKKIHENNVEACFGADELSHFLDQGRGLDAFVHLSFMNDHPMYHVALSRGSIANPVWIEIDISILDDREAVFSPEVANKNGAKIYRMDKVDEKINFNKMYHRDFDIRKNARKAELMIFGKIKKKYIVSICDVNTGETYGK